MKFSQGWPFRKISGIGTLVRDYHQFDAESMLCFFELIFIMLHYHQKFFIMLHYHQKLSYKIFREQNLMDEP